MNFLQKKYLKDTQRHLVPWFTDDWNE